MKSSLVKKFFLAFPLLAALGMAVPAFGDTGLSKVEEIYASLAKLPKDKQQQALLEGARKEGGLMHYGSAEERQIRAVIAGFEKRYPGIKVDLLRAKADELVAKTLLEVRSNKWIFDSISIGPAYHDLKKANALAKLFGLVTEQGFSKNLQGPDWFGRELLPMVIAYNTEMLKAEEAPRSYQDLLDPKWKGKVSLDANPDNLIAAMVKGWGKEKTAAWLNKLVYENDAQLRRGHTAQTKLLIAGEFPVASELYVYRVEYERAVKKAPIEWVIPAGFFEAEVPGNGISRQASHPYAALLWAQYLISVEGQTIYGQFGRLPVNPRATPKFKRHLKIMEDISQGKGTILTPEDAPYFQQAGELIEQIIIPRVRGMK